MKTDIEFKVAAGTCLSAAQKILADEYEVDSDDAITLAESVLAVDQIMPTHVNGKRVIARCILPPRSGERPLEAIVCVLRNEGDPGPAACVYSLRVVGRPGAAGWGQGYYGTRAECLVRFLREVSGRCLPPGMQIDPE